MAFIPAPQTAKVELNATLDTLPVQNVFWFQNDTGITQAKLQVLADNVANWAAGPYAAQLPNALTFGKVVATDWSSQISLQAESSDAQGEVGQNVSEQEPNNVSKLVQFNTSFRGRSARGGFHWMALPNAEVVKNTINGPYISSMLAVAGALVGLGAMGPGWQLVIASFQFNNAPRNVAALFVVQSVTVANLRVGSMRGRLT